MLRALRPYLLSLGVHFLLVLGITAYFLKGGIRKSVEIPIELQLSDVHVHHEDEARARNAGRGVPQQDAPEAPASMSDAVAPGDLSDLNSGARNQYLGTLLRLISSKKNYPRASILNEEEGVVQIRVILGVGGRVLEVERVTSSGFDRLDEAAVATLRAFDVLPLPPGHAAGVKLLIPIRFEINPEH
jgi:TonB family protein